MQADVMKEDNVSGARRTGTADPDKKMMHLLRWGTSDNKNTKPLGGWKTMDDMTAVSRQ